MANVLKVEKRVVEVEVPMFRNRAIIITTGTEYYVIRHPAHKVYFWCGYTTRQDAEYVAARLELNGRNEAFSPIDMAVNYRRELPVCISAL